MADTPLKFWQVLAQELIALGTIPPPPAGTDLSTELLLCSYLQTVGILATDERGLYKYLHSLYRSDDVNRGAALCLSGGGIRSATFNLGVLQGLATMGLLQQLDYLSTVSGGGYIGSWLSAWVHRKGGECGVVAGQLADDPQAGPVSHLRDYTNYLIPRLGYFSADSWTLLATYIRNLLLNWLVLIPAFMTLLNLPRLFVAATVAARKSQSLSRLGLGEPLVLSGISILLFIIALAFLQRSQTSGRTASGQPNPTQGEFLLIFLLPMVLGSWFLSLAWASVVDYLSFICDDWYTLTLCFGALNFIGCFIGLLLSRRVSFSGLVWLFINILITGAIVGVGLKWFGSCTDYHHLSPSAHPTAYSALAAPAVMLIFLVGAVAWAGLSSKSIFSTNADLEWWARENGWVWMVIVSWLGLSILTLFGPRTFVWLQTDHVLIHTLLPLTGIVTAWLGSSSRTPANRDQARKAGFGLYARQWALALAAPIFIVLLVVFLSMVSDWLVFKLFCVGQFNLHDLLTLQSFDDHEKILSGIHLMQAAEFVGGLAVVAFVLSILIDVNKFSLHGVYRNRLARAYLGASNPSPSPPRDRFTGFCESDNLPMFDLKENIDAPQPFIHVLNIALNLVGGEKLAWQERKAASFTVTPLHAGCCSADMNAFVPVQLYSGGLDHPHAHRAGVAPDAITLATAMAISGAAVSPNWGYHSSPAIALLLTLFNVRLGAWLRNPAWTGRLGRRFSPSIWPLIREALGLTTDKGPYAYLSDGGHFENLGLYEMVRRRCRYIVVSDADADPDCKFEDLGNAIRKVRIDLGVEIELIDVQKILPRSKEKRGGYFATGVIRYSRMRLDGDQAVDGQLLYIKPALYDDAPQDVCSYGNVNREFPHDTTLDQFFTESQFESYRALGQFIVGQTWGVPTVKPSSFDEFLTKVQKEGEWISFKVSECPMQPADARVFLSINVPDWDDPLEIKMDQTIPGVWSTQLRLRARAYEYKYLRRDLNGALVGWEPEPYHNHTVDYPSNSPDLWGR